VYRETALKHFKERFELAEAEYNRLLTVTTNKDEHITLFNRYVRNMGFEPFTHNRVDWKNKFTADSWLSEYPNIDIKNGMNATGQRWNKEDYRNQKLLVDWRETDTEIEGWGSTQEIIKTIQ